MQFLVFIFLACVISMTTGISCWPFLVAAVFLDLMWHCRCRCQSERAPTEPEAPPKGNAQLEREFRTRLEEAQKMPKPRWR